MGKAKKRSIALGKHNQFANLSREEAVKTVVSMINKKTDEITDLITLFGLTAEELLEGGAQYEDVVGLGSILK